MKKRLKKQLITALASLSLLLAAGNFHSGKVMAVETPTAFEWQSYNSSGLAAVTGQSTQPVISNDGRYVTFTSTAALVKADTDTYSDIYLRDRLTGNLELISVSSDGVKGNGNSMAPVISDDGRYVAYSSAATNLVPGVAGTSAFVTSNVYLKDRETGVTKLISESSTGTIGNKISNEPAISGDGRYITFTSLATNLVNTPSYSAQVFIHDQLNGTTELVSVGSSGQAGLGDSKTSSVSKDGRFIAYTSIASNLVNNDTNQAWDAFVYDRNSGQTIRVSVSSKGEESQQPAGFGGYGVKYPILSADGRYVAFYSLANGLVDAGTNGKWNVYLHDLKTGLTELISKSNNGMPANDNTAPSDVNRNYLSSDGTLVAFQSYSPNLGVIGTSSRVFTRDRRTNETKMLNPLVTGQISACIPALNASGRYLVFQSSDNGLVTNDRNWSTDIYLADLGERLPLDALAPSTNISLKGIQGANDWYASNVIFNLSAEDNQGGLGVEKIEYSFDGVNWQQFTNPMVMDLEGEFTIYYRAVDQAGNVEEIHKQVVNIDKTAPEITTNLVEGDELERLGVFTLDSSAIDNLSEVVDLTTYLDGNIIDNSGGINLEKLAFGQHSLIIMAEDMAGNVNVKEINFNVTASNETLKNLVLRYYTKGLIDNKGIYNSLVVKLSKKELAAFSSEVMAQRDKHINGVVADRLLEYARWIIDLKS